MFGSGNGWIGHQYFFLNNAPATYGVDGHRVPGVLLVPVRLRRHVQHDHVGCDGRPDRVRRRPHLQHRGERVHLPDHRPLDLGSRRLARDDEDAVPRLRRFHGRAHGRRHDRARRCDRARTAHRSQVQAGRRRHATRSRHDARRTRRRDPVVRLVRLQPRLARCRRWTSPASAGSRPTPRSPRAPAVSWRCSSSIPARTSGTRASSINGFLAGLVAITVSVLLGVAVRCDLHRCDRRGGHGARRRPRRVAADRRPDRRGRRCTVRAASSARSVWVCSPPVSTDCPDRPAPTRRRPVEGLFYGGGTKQLGVQMLGSAVVTVAVFAVALLVMYAVKALGVLRVSEEVELGGIDIHEHGAPAYHPEFAYMGHSAIPSGGSRAASRSRVGRRATPSASATDRHDRERGDDACISSPQSSSRIDSKTSRRH